MELNVFAAEYGPTQTEGAVKRHLPRFASIFIRYLPEYILALRQNALRLKDQYLNCNYISKCISRVKHVSNIIQKIHTTYAI